MQWQTVDILLYVGAWWIIGSGVYLVYSMWRDMRSAGDGAGE